MNFRDVFVGLEHFVQLKNGGYVNHINFDNGTTTPPMAKVVKEIDRNLDYYASVGRGGGQKAEYCANRMEEARKEILGFFHLKPDEGYTVIYVKSATEGLNMLASMLAKKESVVLATRMEHYSNDLPWRRYAGKVEYAEVDRDGRLSLLLLEEKLALWKGKIKYVTVTAASNVTGYVNDLHKLAALCHGYGARIIVDAAQIVPHRELNMRGRRKEEQIDFLVFSAYKAYAPFGSGAVIGLSNELSQNVPLLTGSSAVSQVYDDGYQFLENPERMEAGSQNFFGITAMTEALKTIQSISFQKIQEQEEGLKEYLLKELEAMPHIVLYGAHAKQVERLGIIPFNVKGRNCGDVTRELAENAGITTGCGMFCAQPYVMRLLHKENREKSLFSDTGGGMVRVSLGIYNTRAEADIFLNYMDTIKNG